MSEKPQLPEEARARRRRFEGLYAAHQAQLLGYVLRRTERVEDAADVIADVFLVAWRRLDEAPVGDDARLWLYGVARRVLANHRRGERRRVQLADRLRSDLAGRPTPDSADGEVSELAAAFSSLSSGDREVLALEAWEELDAREIAAVLGCSSNAARIRLHRARRRLRAAIDAFQDLARNGSCVALQGAAVWTRLAEDGEAQHRAASEHGRERSARTIAVRGNVS